MKRSVIALAVLLVGCTSSAPESEPPKSSVSEAKDVKPINNDSKTASSPPTETTTAKQPAANADPQNDTQPQNQPTLVGTGIKETILILAMNANALLEPQYHHDFQLVSTNEDNARSAIYRDKNSGLILIATGPRDDLTLIELWMSLEEFVGEENGQATGEGAAAFGRCVQRLGFAADPSWSEDLYNWMNQQMARALLTPDGVYTARKDFVAKFGTTKIEDDKMMVTMTIGRISKSQ